MQVCIVSLLLIASHVLAAPFAYITNSGSNTVTVIDIATNTVIGSPIPVGIQPYGVAANTQGTRVYATNSGSNSVSVIDTATNSVVATIAVGANPRGIAVDAAGTRVYVANAGAVSVIDTATNMVVATSAVIGAVDIALNPADTRVYVTAADSSIAVLDTATNAAVALLPDPYLEYDAILGDPLHSQMGGIAVDPTGSRVYVTYLTNWEGPRIPIGRIIDAQTNQFLPSIIRAGWSAVAVDPRGRNVFTVWGGVWRLDTHTNVVDLGLVRVGAQLIVGAGGAVDPTGSRFYVVDPFTNSVVAVNTATLQPIGAPIPVGSRPVAMGLFIGPGAPLTHAAVSPIPTLGGWAVVLLALLVAGTAGRSRRL